eukprot:CAMPEP_0179090928 /NCGR_PEP_ID=MMETSP0796-20121207/41508_1 /TAXON_ID=73915 /ORGANISM="Pyrodinium bahamense, Strain pbaha01" /LENGTH=114 /DNA_ID=CAMNT_0020788505 /DNA_START=82 /DNA_END=423 /DNA_ORIENTATION=+
MQVQLSPWIASDPYIKGHDLAANGARVELRLATGPQTHLRNSMFARATRDPDTADTYENIQVLHILVRIRVELVILFANSLQCLRGFLNVKVTELDLHRSKLSSNAIFSNAKVW